MCNLPKDLFRPFNNRRGSRKVSANKIPFIKRWMHFDPNLVTGNKVLSLDHYACHDKKCMNPFHHDTTYLDVNSSRDGCWLEKCLHDSEGMANKCVIRRDQFVGGIVPFV